MLHLGHIMRERFEAKNSGALFPIPITPDLPNNIACSSIPPKEELKSFRSRFNKNIIYILSFVRFYICNISIRNTRNLVI